MAGTTNPPAAGSLDAETPPASDKTLARVVAVQESLVTLRAGRQDDGHRLPLKKNEVVFIEPGRVGREGRRESLKAEVLRVRGEFADAQVFEDTAGVAVGDPVRQSGEMLSVVLGPGLLGQVYDGLQNPLDSIAIRHGTFLPRGADMAPLDFNRKWSFVPRVQRSWCPSISLARWR
jgi:V/A-type H+-transporting ATPase subunit A